MNKRNTRKIQKKQKIEGAGIFDNLKSVASSIPSTLSTAKNVSRFFVTRILNPSDVNFCK